MLFKRGHYRIKNDQKFYKTEYRLFNWLLIYSTEYFSESDLSLEDGITIEWN